MSPSIIIPAAEAMRLLNCGSPQALRRKVIKRPAMRLGRNEYSRAEVERYAEPKQPRRGAWRPSK